MYTTDQKPKETKMTNYDHHYRPTMYLVVRDGTVSHHHTTSGAIRLRRGGVIVRRAVSVNSPRLSSELLATAGAIIDRGYLYLPY